MLFNSGSIWKGVSSMGFWFFMMICELIIPVFMIVFGSLFKKNPPKEINNTFGYRTKRSKTNFETWTLAHNYFGAIWQKIGIVVLIITVVVLFLVLGKSEDVIGYTGLALTVMQLVFVLMPIPFTENRLKKYLKEK